MSIWFWPALHTVFNELSSSLYPVYRRKQLLWLEANGCTYSSSSLYRVYRSTLLLVLVLVLEANGGTHSMLFLFRCANVSDTDVMASDSSSGMTRPNSS